MPIHRNSAGPCGPPSSPANDDALTGVHDFLGLTARVDHRPPSLSEHLLNRGRATAGFPIGKVAGRVPFDIISEGLGGELEPRKRGPNAFDDLNVLPRHGPQYPAAS